MRIVLLSNILPSSCFAVLLFYCFPVFLFSVFLFFCSSVLLFSDFESYEGLCLGVVW
jgi:hypothetical protein